jgi:hypothetical protein
MFADNVHRIVKGVSPMPFTFSGTSYDRLANFFTVTFNADAAGAVDRFIWQAPFHARLVGLREVHSTAGGTSAAIRPRKVTADATAPGATAGATVIELTTAAIDLTATANTSQTPTLVSSATHFKPGDRLGLDASGTMTALVGLNLTFVFERL